jgi:hypothetical protein
MHPYLRGAWWPKQTSCKSGNGSKAGGVTHFTELQPRSALGVVGSILPPNFHYFFTPSVHVRFPAGAGNFSLNNGVQNSSGTHPASYPMGTRGSFPGGKVDGVWSWPLTSI